MSATDARTVKLSEARSLILHAFNHKRPVFLWGPPGIGKSDLAQQITDSLSGLLIDVRLPLWEPTDIKGIPFFNSKTKKMEWAPPTELPDAVLAKKWPIIVLLLDELNSAPPSVQAAAYQLILNRKVGTYSLPENVVIVACGNRETDKGVTYRMPKPLANRFFHMEVRVDYEDWLDWATNNNIEPDVVGYITVNKQDLYDFDPTADGHSFATPRSWTFVSDMLPDVPEELLTDMVAGCVGEGLAIKFKNHMKVAGKMPNPTHVLAGKVKELKVKEVSAMYALATSLCYELKDSFEHLTKKDKRPTWDKYADNFFRFIMDNFEPEMVIMASRLAIKNYNLPFNHRKLKNFGEFFERYGKLIQKA